MSTALRSVALGSIARRPRGSYHANIVACVLAAFSLVACDGSAVTEPEDAGTALVIRADPEAPSYRVGTTVQLRTDRPSRWTVETDGVRRDVAIDTTSIGVELSREGWTVVSACDDTGCGHRGLYATLADLAIDIELDEYDLRFRVRTASELQAFASVWAPERGYLIEEVVEPGTWILTRRGSGQQPDRIEFSAFTRTQYVTRALDVWPLLWVTNPGGRAALNANTMAGCEPLRDMFTRVLVHEPWEPFVYEDLVVAVTSVRIDDEECTRVQVSGTSSGQYEGADATGTFDAIVNWESSTPPNPPRPLAAFWITDLRATHVNLPIENAISMPVQRFWERFSQAPFEALTAEIRTPSGMIVTPRFGACIGCLDEVAFQLQGSYLTAYVAHDCGPRERPPIALGPGLFQAMLASWWLQHGDHAPWTDLGVETLDLPPVIAKRSDDDDLSPPTLVLAQMAVTAGGTTYVGRLEQPLRNSIEALGWEPEGEPSVWLLDGRRLTSGAVPAERPIYDAFASAFAEIYPEIRRLLQLPRPDPIARWIEAFPSAALDRFVLEPAECLPSNRTCARVCGVWARLP